MYKIEVPEEARTIINTIQSQGFEAYVVGGCVRDCILGRTPNDWDITTSAKPEQVKAMFMRTIDTGLKHGTVTVLMGKDQYEVTTYRIDGEYLDGRHPENVVFTDLLSEDLKRRDFTINAMAYNDEKGLVDLFDGIKDINEGIIRCVGDATQRFNEDALRMMRAIRFAAQLNYTIEENTYCAICELKDNIAFISAERIRTEMEKLLVSDHPYMFKLFYETGLTAHFMPEFDEAMKTNQNHKHHMYSVGEHILHSLCNIENDKALRLTMLLHDIAKPECLVVDEEGITHFYGHQDNSARMAADILGRLRYDNDTIDLVTCLVKYHDQRPERKAKHIRRLMLKMGKDRYPLYLKVSRADILAQSDYKRQEKLEDLDAWEAIYNEIIQNNQCVSMKELAVKGSDLINAGIAPGPGLGDILKKMLEDVIEDPSHNNKEYLLATYLK